MGFFLSYMFMDNFFLGNLFSFWTFDIHSAEQMMAAVSLWSKKTRPKGHYIVLNVAYLNPLQFNHLKITTSIFDILEKKPMQ